MRFGSKNSKPKFVSFPSNVYFILYLIVSVRIIQLEKLISILWNYNSSGKIPKHNRVNFRQMPFNYSCRICSFHPRVENSTGSNREWVTTRNVFHPRLKCSVYPRLKCSVSKCCSIQRNFSKSKSNPNYFEPSRYYMM